jgi:adenylate kinase
MTVEAEKANILITGTPGCGKTTLAQKLAEATGLRHVHVGDLIKREKLYDEYDEEYDSYILNEDKVKLYAVPLIRKLCDAVAPEILQGGAILDYHSCDFFGEDWFDLIIVLRTETKVLYDRLSSRYLQQVSR